MIDIHAHIIPGIDDGSPDMSTSLAMAEIAAENGTDAIIVTPHCNQRGLYENYTSPELSDRFEDLKRELALAEIPIELYLGSEVYGTPEVPELYEQGRLPTLNGSRFLLIEFDFYAGAVFMQNVLYKLIEKGAVPILAHPERYYALQIQPDTAMAWHDDGVEIQINKGSLFGRFGSSAAGLAHTLLKYGSVSIVASDAHGANRRTPDMTDAFGYISANYSEELAELLLCENPERVLGNRRLLRADRFQIY